MKKIFLAIFLFTALQMFAQVNRETVFDFTNPLGLTPSITPATSNGGDEPVNDRVFKSGPISISFGRLGDSPNPGARIVTFINGNTKETTYYLKLSLFTTMTFKGAEGVTIKSIKISDDSTIGGFSLTDGQPGKLDYFTWSSNGNNSVNSVGFNVSGSSASAFHKITVAYTEPSDILSPVSTDIADGSTMPSFQEINLTFADNMSILNAGNITFSNADNSISKKMTTSVDGRNIKLRLDEPINTDGTYTITIPARSFKNANGYENKKLTYTVKVSIPKNILNYESVDPEPGEYDKIAKAVFTLTYNKPVEVIGKPEVYLKKDSEVYSRTTVTEGAHSKQVVVEFKKLPEGLIDKGNYTIEFPEHIIADQGGMHYNPAFTLEYKVGYEKEIEDSETLKLAKQLLQMQGVGYPTANSEAYVALAALVESEETPEDDALQAAIDALYNETNVEKPADGKYYTIAGINSTGTTKLYMVYNSTEGLKFSTKPGDASAFEAVATGNGKYELRTTDGKNLYVGGIAGDKDPKALSFNKMSKEIPDASVDAKDLFGCMTITSDIQIEGTVKTIPAILNYEDESLIDNVSESTLYFNETRSTAFLMAETQKPEEAKDLALTPTVTPDEIVGSGILTITFTGSETVTIADDKLPYFATKEGNRIDASGIFAASEEANTFNVNVSEYSAGEYKLVLPKGTFACIKDDIKYGVKDITADFKITEKQQDYDFNYNYSTFSYYGVPNDSETPMMDTDLNNIIISVPSSWYSGLVPDKTKTVEVVRYRDNHLIGKGHFETTTIPENYTYAIRLVLDTPIKEGDLPIEFYTIKIQKATFGDANFGKFINGDRTIKPSECRANPGSTKTFYVNNAMASSITDVNASGTSAGKVIYDLTGRRVESMSRPGVYIVNGKKVVVGK